MGKFDWIREEFQEFKDKGLYVIIRKFESVQGLWVVVDGKKVFNMCFNNYFGLVVYLEIRYVVIRVIFDYGVGVGVVRIIVGIMEFYVEFEEKLVKFKKREVVIFFQSGYNVNFGVISVFFKKGEDGVFISEEFNYVSIIDGMCFSGVFKVIYKYIDMEDLKKCFEENKDKKKKIIVSDGVFLMDGDLVLFLEMVELVEQYDVIFYIDDVYGEGVFGDSGRGIVDYFKFYDKVDFEMGIFSKVFGVIGGYVVGLEEVIEYFCQRVRLFFFLSVLNLFDVVVVIVVVEIFQRSDEFVRKFWDNINFFQKGFRDFGYDFGNIKYLIILVMFYDEKFVQEFLRRLYDEYNIFVQVIVYLIVLFGIVRIRFEFLVVYSKEDFQYVIDVFEDFGKKIGFLK